MNNNKKSLITILCAILFIISLLIIFTKDKNSDGIKFKEEYESLNDTVAYNNFKYPKVSLDNENPFVYKTEDEIIDIIKNGTGIIYFGFPKCPWCRNAVNVLQNINVDKIYYLNVYEIRDEYKIVDGEIKKTKEGSKGYKQIINLLENILTDYIIEENDEKYNVNEKRIYVPLVIGVREGKIVDYHMNTVNLNDGQTAFDLLDEKQTQKLFDIYENINVNVNSDLCDIDNTGGC